MTDELDNIVRGLEAERARPSRWWRTTWHPSPQVVVDDDLAARRRLRDLADGIAETEWTWATRKDA